MRKETLLTFIVAAAGSTATADDFTWKVGTVGPWSNPDNWNGPGFPDSAADNASVSGASSKAYVDMSLTVKNLVINDGAEVHNEFNGPSHLWVAGDSTVSGLDSMLHIVPEGPLDFLTNELTLTDWGQLFLDDGYALFEDQVWIGNNGYLKGSGLINMGSNAGDFILATQADIYVGGAAGDTLRLDTYGDSARMDWGANAWKISIWPGRTFEMMLKPKNAMNGIIDIADGAVFETEHAWIASSGSYIEIGGDAEIVGLAMDVYGTFRVVGNGQHSHVDMGLVAFRDEVILGDPDLFLHGNTILNGAHVSAAENTNGSVRFGPGASTLTIQGDTVVSTPGMFDIDGQVGNLQVVVTEDASFVLDAGLHDEDPNNPFNGEIVLEGSALFTNILDNEGTVTMDGGTFFGNTIHNNGVITGHGDVVNTVYNNDQIVAAGGTLQLSSVSILDGAFEIGHVLAVDGDIVLTGDENQHFNGSMWVGNGAGIREVFDMNGDLAISKDYGVPGSLSMNGGRINAQEISLESAFSNEGDSILSTYGQGEIIFRNGSDNDINGLLTLWQDGDIESAASFTGSGTLATYPNRTLNLRNSVDTGSVAILNAGIVQLQGALSGVVNVGAYSQTPSGTFSATVSNGSHDRLISDTTIELDGALHVGVTNGFVPQNGASYTIMQGELVTGTFDAVTTDPEIGKAIVDVTDTEVIITVTCTADINGDGVLNILDFVAFQEKWQAGDPEGDCDNNGFFNILDFVCFQTLFQQGC